jgi:hypothetical protein
MNPHSSYAAAAGKAAAGLRANLRQASKMGRGGDTMLAHINPQEAQMLKAAGGAGTINPATGLPEFRPSGSWGKDAPASGGRVGGQLGNTGAGKNGSRGGTVGLGSTPQTKAAAFGKSIYSDIKIANPESGRILNPSDYGGIVTQSGDNKYSTGNDDHAYNAAIDNWNQRDFGDRLLNFFAPLGLTSVKPEYSRPATYSGGDFHTGVNPAAAGAGLLSMLGPPGLGTLVSPIAGAAWDAFGGQNPVLTGPDTVYADDGTGGMARPGSPSISGPMGGRPQSGERTGVGNPMIPGPTQAQAPQIFGPQAQAPQPGAPPLPPSIFPKPPVQSPFQVPGGKPYGFSLFGRAA